MAKKSIVTHFRDEKGMRLTLGDLIFKVVVYLILITLTIATLYPVLHVVFASVSDPVELRNHYGLLAGPRGFTTEGYKLVFNDDRIMGGYKNTLIYVSLGTAVNMIFTILAAFTLSRKDMMLKKFFNILMTITMFFGGGLIPWFLITKELGMYNNLAAMIIPTAISTWNIILLRTGFQQVPRELEEAAEVDGASQAFILFKVYIPLSKAIIAVILLYYLVGNWNSWFNPMILLKDREKFPLQLYLREILIVNEASGATQAGANSHAVSTAIGTSAYRELLKYATIVVSTAPIMCIYPFLQKYFIKGVFVGSIKG